LNINILKVELDASLLDLIPIVKNSSKINSEQIQSVFRESQKLLTTAFLDDEQDVLDLRKFCKTQKEQNDYNIETNLDKMYEIKIDKEREEFDNRKEDLAQSTQSYNSIFSD